MLTRAAPPLTLHKLRAYQQMTELTIQDCRFDEAEMAALLKQLVGTAVGIETLAMLSHRTEGWAAGLQIAALSLRQQLRRGLDLSQALNHFAGHEQHIFAYLGAEVLGQQPAEMRDFLGKTAVLPRFNPDLCNAITNRDDSQALLDRLAQDNFFLITLDQKQAWYRYHHLFADFLQSKLSQAERQHILQRTGAWFAAKAQWREAVEYAIAAADFAHAAQLIEEQADALLGRGEWNLIASWLDNLPTAVFAQHPFLLVLHGLVLLLINQVESAKLCAEQAAAYEPQLVTPRQRGMYLLLQAVLAKFRYEYAQAVQLTTAATTALVDNSGFLEQVASFYVATMTHNRVLKVERWQTIWQQSRQQKRSLLISAASWELSETLNELGQLQAAITVCHTSRQELAPSIHLPSSGPATVALALLLYETNDLAEAEGLLEAGLPACRQFGHQYYVLLGEVLQAKLALARQASETAFEVLQVTNQQARHWGNIEIRYAVEIETLNLQLRLGFAAPVKHWVDQTVLEPVALDESFVSYINQLLRVRFYLTQNRLKQARQVLAQLMAILAEQRLHSGLISAYILQALVEQAGGKQRQAELALEQAVLLAAPEGYVRRFVDEGTAVLPLLKAIQPSAPYFVSKLIAAFAAETAEESSVAITSTVPAADQPAERLRLQLFGTFQLHLDEQPVAKLYSTRVRALLAYLALAPNEPHSRDQLMTLLWSDYSTSKARSNLRNALSVLRRILGEEKGGKRPLLDISRQAIQLNLDLNQHHIDALTFQAHLAFSQEHKHESLLACPGCISVLTQAAELYKGNLLSDIILADSPPFDEWRLFEQERFHRLALTTLATLMEHHATARRYEQVQHYAQQQLVLEPWSEKAHWHLVHALSQTGKRAAAVAQYKRCSDILMDELGISPGPEIESLALELGLQTA